jgi:rhodanese-related sulfurtransferase
MKVLTAKELSNKIANNDDILILDVREPNEFQYASIKSSVLIPLNQIPERIAELDAEQEIVVVCHHGIRSQKAAHYLIHSGFQHVYNLQGGIDAWSCECDNSVPRY